MYSAYIRGGENGKRKKEEKEKEKRVVEGKRREDWTHSIQPPPAPTKPTIGWQMEVINPGDPNPLKSGLFGAKDAV